MFKKNTKRLEKKVSIIISVISTFDYLSTFWWRIEKKMWMSK